MYELLCVSNSVCIDACVHVRARAHVSACGIAYRRLGELRHGVGITAMPYTVVVSGACFVVPEYGCSSLIYLVQGQKSVLPYLSQSSYSPLCRGWCGA